MSKSACPLRCQSSIDVALPDEADRETVATLRNGLRWTLVDDDARLEALLSQR